NTNPAIDDQTSVEYIHRMGRQARKTFIYVMGAMTKGRQGQELAEMGLMAGAGAVGFTDDGNGVQDAAMMLRALKYAAMFDVVIAQHCQDIGIAIETSHGAWVQALLDRGYKVYPVNPKTVEPFREALSAAGHKSDKIDRKVLAMFLATFHQDNKLPEADWVRSLPGAGDVLAPSLLACLGRNQQRFATAADARAFMGTAPVTKASGNYRSVHFRRGCWKFARRTLQLFADKSRHQCAWAQAFYEKQRNSGHNHHA
ncbi:unnamed protein product, partial [marine sediment metagenome]